MKQRIAAIVLIIIMLIMILATIFIPTYVIDRYDNNYVGKTAGIVNDLKVTLPEKEVTVEEEIIEEVSEEVELETGYASTGINVRSRPSMEDDAIIGTIYINTEIKYEKILGEEYDWCKFEHNGEDAYVRADLVSDEQVEIVQTNTVKQQNYTEQKTQTNNTVKETPTPTNTSTYNGTVLTKQAGTIQGPSGKETYYNLPMNNCIRYMNDLGYNYEYWVRDDGVKMFGDYVMTAGDTNKTPKGTVVETSLGQGIIVDHCEASEWGVNGYDIAVAW